MQALLIVIVTCHVSCVTVTACHTLAWVGEIPPPIDDLSRATGRSVFSILCYAMLQPKPDTALYLTKVQGVVSGVCGSSLVDILRLIPAPRPDRESALKMMSTSVW